MAKRKVLIPLDGSAASRQVVPVVAEYVKPEEAELILLRVALPVVLPSETMPYSRYESDRPEPRASYVWSTQEQEAYRQQVQDELKDDATELRQLGYQVTTEVLFGEPAPEIIEYVKHANIDLIAMTTHGRTGLGRLVLGSVAESVLRNVDIPILLLRARTGSAEDQQ
ncbi:MAG: hypothetical protein DCC55_33780 [Chloroflexi bacterium]|nr:MAG: hypothetical protein DCC55_33780 [Chloroflexota bacterium]